MRIHIGFELVFNIPAPVSMLLMLHVHPEQAHVLQKPEYLELDPVAPVSFQTDVYGNLAARVVAPAGTFRIQYDNVAWDSGHREPRIDGAFLHPVDQLPPECLSFLLASRYCEVDRMSQIAWDLFGRTPHSWERVQAVLDWVHNHVKFGYEFASSSKTAFDVYTEGRGVCRDFMHLTITLLRALNIPARYATGYLGDIGVPPPALPMDFSAWLEVYLGNRWYTVDARHTEPRIGRILQARGRDAVDVALTTSFGPSTLTSFRVWTDELK